jgi:HD-like signal output (HDOD) protein
MSTVPSRAAPTCASPPGVGESAHDSRALALLFLRNLAAEVSGGTVNLPSFPDVVIRIRKSLADPNASLNQTAKLISTEPRLAALLLQSANSAAFNPGGHGVTDLRAAITRLGHRAVQSSAMAFAVRQIRLAPALRAIAKPLNVLWDESFTVAAVCQVLARRTAVAPDEAFLTGLMHGIGSFQRLALTSHECASHMQIAEHQLGSLHAALGC